MMAQYKDVGLGGGQTLWHRLKGGGGVSWRETGQDWDADGSQSFEAAPTKGRVDPRRPDRGVLSNYYRSPELRPPPQVPASVLSRGVLLLTCGCESLLYPHCGNQDLMNRDEVLNIAP